MYTYEEWAPLPSADKPTADRRAVQRTLVVVKIKPSAQISPHRIGPWFDTKNFKPSSTKERERAYPPLGWIQQRLRKINFLADVYAVEDNKNPYS